jgi:hypothetical protein
VQVAKIDHYIRAWHALHDVHIVFGAAELPGIARGLQADERLQALIGPYPADLHQMAF